MIRLINALAYTAGVLTALFNWPLVPIAGTVILLAVGAVYLI